jgi:YidC/Oxa1 family membrane protein insertase
MEYIYMNTGLPWWGTIIAATLCIRVAFLPVNIFLQKNAIKMHNVNPLVKEMKENQQLYLIAGDMESSNHERQKMNAVFKEHGVRPILSVIPGIFQGAVMLSFFLALRGMVNAPVTSMMAGGALWFPDLTAADPAFILPLLSSVGMLVSIEVSL